MQFPYEKEAIRGEPMPKDLSLADQMAYQALSSMYSRFRVRAITREQGAEEKKKLFLTYDKAYRQREREVNMAQHYAEQNARIESAANDYAKDRTLENADKLYKALYGMEPTKKEEP
jgi:hypothetical protein